jgi:hypothetical protein
MTPAVIPAPPTDRSWALFPHGLLVFERPDPAGPSRLLISRIESCTAPKCACRDVGLRAVTLDVGDDFSPDALSETLRARLESPDAMNARLAIDLGTVEPDDYEGRVPLSADWATYAQSQVDGELLDLLHAQWLRAKGMAPAPKTDWEPRDPADLVGWNEAHPADRRDLYLDDDKLFVAQELYCVNPTCTCNEAMVAFSPTTRGSPDVGALRVRIPTLEIVERDVHSKRATLLDRLWNAFSARHRHLSERLAERNKQMLDLASTHAQPRRPATRAAGAVGRNQPCPCGSGKKYKRCCGL